MTSTKFAGQEDYVPLAWAAVMDGTGRVNADGSTTVEIPADPAAYDARLPGHCYNGGWREVTLMVTDQGFVVER